MAIKQGHLVGAMLVVVLLAAGCSAEFWDKAGGVSKKIEQGATTGGAVVGSPEAKTVAVVTGTEPERKILEIVLASVAGLASAATGYFAKKAAAERTKKKAYKAACTPEGTNTANKMIYGDSYNPALSK